MRLRYSSTGRLRQLITPQGQVGSVLWDKEASHISQIQSKQGDLRTYVYENANLVRVLTESKKFSSYSYDHFHNMTLAMRGGRKEEFISYDTLADRVTQVQSASGCFESYRYQNRNSQWLLNQIVHIEKSCPHQTPQKWTHFYKHKRGANNSYSLTYFRSQQGSLIQEVHYAPLRGPVSLPILNVSPTPTKETNNEKGQY